MKIRRIFKVLLLISLLTSLALAGCGKKFDPESAARDAVRFSVKALIIPTYNDPSPQIQITDLKIEEDDTFTASGKVTFKAGSSGSMTRTFKSGGTIDRKEKTAHTDYNKTVIE